MNLHYKDKSSQASSEVKIVDGAPAIDSFLIGQIVSVNSFGCPFSSRDRHRALLEESVKDKSAEGVFHSSGIWPVASCINHSCFSNARRSFIGDMMIVRASRDIEPNTELRWWYFSPSYEDYKLNTKTWNFTCNCAICTEKRCQSASQLAKGASLEKRVLDLLKAPSKVNLAKVEAIIKSVNDQFQRPPTEVPRVDLLQTHLALAQHYVLNFPPNFTRGLEYALRGLECQGYIIEGAIPGSSTSGKNGLTIKARGFMTDTIVHCWLLLSFVYLRLGHRELELQAHEQAKLAYKVCVGEDESFADICKPGNLFY